MKKVFLIVLCLLSSLFLFGCSNKEEEERIKLEIRQIYCDYYNENRYELSKEKTIDDVEIRHYLGKCGDGYMAIIKGDATVRINPPGIETYVICVNGEDFSDMKSWKEYTFNYLPEWISVYYNGEYYYADSACFKQIESKGELNIFTQKDMDKVYKVYKKIEKEYNE